MMNFTPVERILSLNMGYTFIKNIRDREFSEIIGFVMA